jgi:methionyl-tRNA formyltransferase
MHDKIMIFTNGSFYSYILLKDLIEKHNKSITSIYISKPLKKKNYRKFFVRKVLNGLGFNYYLQRILHNVRCKHNGISVFNLANKYNISTIYVSNVNEIQTMNRIKADKPDIIISGYFDQIIKKEVIQIPSFGILNVHSSMLPKYRGVKPVFWVLKNNESKTGVTIHLVDVGLDSGEIIDQKEVDILPTDSVDSLSKRMSEVAGNLLLTTVENIQMNKYELKRQNLEAGSYYSQPTKHDLVVFKSHGKKFY